MCQIPLNPIVSGYAQKCSETQLEHSGARIPQRRWVFLGFLFDVVSMGRLSLVLLFSVLGYPFNPTYGTIRFFKIDPYGCGCKPHHRCQFRGFSRHRARGSLQMPPLRGLIPFLTDAAINIPSLCD